MGEKEFYPRSAARALELIGKNVVVKAFQMPINQNMVNINSSELAEALLRGRQRVLEALQR